MPLPQEKIYTVEDIYALPAGQRAELIDGEIFYMAPPNTAHQRISSVLHAAIFNYIRDNGGSCEVFHAPFAVFLTNDSANYLEPDLSVICDKGKIDGTGCKGAPDWVIEIVSPGSKRMDYYTKLSLYRAAGVREYWIVDPMKRVSIVYDMEHDDGPVLHSFSEAVHCHIYPGFSISLSDWHI